MARPGQAVLAMLAWSWLAVLATCLQLDKSWLQSGRLQDGLLLQVTVPTLYQCLHLCVGRSLCRSVSFHRPSSQCQLNVQSVGSGVSLTSQADWLYLDRQHFQHKDLAGPCLNHNCLDHEFCLPSGCKTSVCISAGQPPSTTSTAVPTTMAEETTTALTTTSQPETSQPTSVATTDEPTTTSVATATQATTASVATTTQSTTSTAAATTQATTTSAQTTAQSTTTAVPTTTQSTTTTVASAVAATAAFSHVDCGSAPAAPEGMTLTSSTGTRYHDTANYTCNGGTIWPDTGFLFCNESSQWQGDPGGCSYTTCYDPGLPSSYSGTLSVTSGGITCQRWETTSPNFHVYLFPIFHRVDGNAKAANNYCRAIADPRPWCYKTTSYLFNRWDYCDVPQC